jgi:hypothetical protein
MKWKSILLLGFVVFVAGCKSSRHTGQIFERKEATGNKFLIKYTYLVDGKERIDSATVDNVVLPGDSINVKRFLSRLRKQ